MISLLRNRVETKRFVHIRNFLFKLSITIIIVDDLPSTEKKKKKKSYTNEKNQIEHTKP